MSTTLYFKQQFNSAAGVSGGAGTYQYASLVRSVLALVTAVTNTATAGSNIQMTQTAGGAAIAFVSPPVAAGFILTGDITCNLWAKTNLLSANTTVAMAFYKLSGGVLGTAFLITSFGTAVGATITNCNWTSGSPTSTTFAAGDRIVAIPLITNATSLVMAGGDTVTMDYAGPTASSDGDGWFQLTETVSFMQEPELIQVAPFALAVSGQTVSGTFPGNNTPGNLIVVLGLCFLNGNPGPLDTLTVADSPSPDTLTALSTNPCLWNSGANSDYQWWGILTGSAAAKTLTFTKSASDTQGFGGVAVEYGGMSPAPFDVCASASNSGNGTAMTTNASPAVHYNNELILAFEDDNGTTVTPESDCIQRIGTEGTEIIEKSVYNGPLTSYTITATLSPSATWFMTVATFKWATQPMGHLELESGTGNIALENGDDIQLESALL